MGFLSIRAPVCSPRDFKVTTVTLKSLARRIFAWLLYLSGLSGILSFTDSIA